MHIPDGYLSPATCTALYAAATPFWYAALRKVRRQLHTRFVPLLAVFAAFSFVIMMFNLPLPGGTTGHATGIGIAAVVLGPWAGMIAISIALMIQALFFGDGGVTALGANCFNMAVAGCLTASFVYRLVAGSSALESRRRVIGAALGGYAGINVAALLTAMEFGIQPMFYRDASGAPLYAPYPLSIAIPAMMIGHLTIAGLAELFVGGSIVSYLQRTDISLLGRTAAAGAEHASGWRSTRPLWAALALLLILTPVGLLSVGSAWGEWAPDDFRNPQGRAEIVKSSGGAPLPKDAPSGLERLSSFWTAPIPDYAPPVFRNPSFGYAMSALAGTGLIILASLGFGLITRGPGRG